MEAAARQLRDDPWVDPNVIADRYELGELVAAGGMGEVYAGRDLKLERAVALKFLRKDMAAHPELRSRFEAEARAAGRLSHPNVVGVFDTDEHDGTPFIVMELLSGRTLADEIANGPATQERARQVGREILSALRASHAEGILHRDLKPGNVLLGEGGSVKVGDFGVAKMAEGMHLTQAGILLGTPAYLAPERIAGEPASASSDIYSVGVILYEMLAGRKPFEADTPLGLMRAIQDAPVPPLAEVRPDVDPGFAAVIERAMARDPATRYASADQMEADLVAGGPVPREPEAAATVATSAPTRVMAQPGSASGSEATLISEPVVRQPRVGAWARLSPRNRLGVALAAALLVLMLLLLRSNAGEPPPSDATPQSTPAGESGGGNLPTPLENALRELEGAVEE